MKTEKTHVCAVKVWTHDNGHQTIPVSLVAAAPELLAACKLAMHDHCALPLAQQSGIIIDALRFAIAKAEGR